MRKILFMLVLLIFFLNLPLTAKEKETDYYALYLNGSRCGYAVQSREVGGDRVINTDNVYFELERMGTPIKLDVTETAIETTDGRPLGFKASQKVATMDMSVDGKISPDGKMKIRITNAGNTTEMAQ